ncbi:MAG: GNAT family N-acetyltransferase [Bacteroidetes bacterium HGW-Bacteroidetes-15]|nr:MAG: GNAT family N-acetyltransferase [Bacteroidetes bacterium HGW-Bacteroidetes-15]
MKKSIVISDSTLDEYSALQIICDSWVDKKLIEGTEFEPNYIHNCLTNGDLPPIPNASKSSYRLKSIYLKHSDELIGFTDLYFGYPTNDSAWISIFMIHERFRNNGYAQEAIAIISQECRKLGYKKIGIGVFLKNWRALRFWTKVGFDKVTSISGDKDYSEESFARIGLEKSLK